MNPHSDISTNFQQLLELDPALPDDLDRVETIDQAVALIVESADRHGVAINAETLMAYLQTQMAATGTALNDESLAGVSGGWIRAGKKLSEFRRKYIDNR